MAPGDVDAADLIMRTAFGTFLGAPDPPSTFGDMEMVRTRYAADGGRAFVATLDGEVVGSNFATRWGSYGFFGPLTVRPDLWDRGVASRLLEPTVELFARWGVRQSALFTFSHSTKHVWLYQRFGFWPQQLTAVTTRAPAAEAAAAPVELHSQLEPEERAAVLEQAAALTDAIFAGLDLRSEIAAADALGVGETVLLRGADGALRGFAVCHCGAGEATAGPHAGADFEALLGACEALAAGRGVAQVIAGVNLARHDAYRRLLARGYRSRMLGVVMQSPNEPGYCRPDAYVVDDLR